VAGNLTSIRERTGFVVLHYLHGMPVINTAGLEAAASAMNDPESPALVIPVERADQANPRMVQMLEVIFAVASQIGIALSQADFIKMQRTKRKVLAKKNKQLRDLSDQVQSFEITCNIWCLAHADCECLMAAVVLEQLRGASRAKSDFLATITHEIRNPLYPVIGLTDLLLDTPLNPEQYDMVDNIRRSSDMLLNLVSDILDFSKFDAGKLQVCGMPIYVTSSTFSLYIDPALWYCVTGSRTFSWIRRCSTWACAWRTRSKWWRPRMGRMRFISRVSFKTTYLSL